ncbi:hypothetical protein RJ639_028943 [Escallonia herrerae]|uniref:Strictosidine synthase conserved region domain-containing protein n=1 Tax=Escallonia herrerae TaxID=1293975 RepID=A0AA89BQG9_9ASTE|nr:hypothetical protein RJ639_028943 [Escallonia herrerae]
MTKQATVLLGGLAGAAGVALSQDGSFLLATEFVTGNIYKFWLKGPKAATAEVIVNLEGYANKIKATTQGDFWVGVIIEGPPHMLLGQRIDEYDSVLETLTFSPEFNPPLISEVYEFNISRLERAVNNISCWYPSITSSMEMAQLTESFSYSFLTSRVQGCKESFKSYYARFNVEKLLIDHLVPGVTFAHG